MFALCASFALFGITATPPVAAAPGRHALAEPPPTVVVKKTPAKKKAKTAKRKKTSKKNEPKTIPDMIRDEFDDHADEAMRVAHCESKFDPGAYNAGAVGVFQILASAHDWRVEKVRGRDLNDARTNIRVARHLFDEQGWGPWTCARIVGVEA